MPSFLTVVTQVAGWSTLMLVKVVVTVVVMLVVRVVVQVLCWDSGDRELAEVERQLEEDGEEREDRLGEALELVAPWCMAQQFGTRVVAQVGSLLLLLLLPILSSSSSFSPPSPPPPPPPPPGVLP